MKDRALGGSPKFASLLRVILRQRRAGLDVRPFRNTRLAGRVQKVLAEEIVVASGTKSD